MTDDRQDLLQGTLDALILRTLALGPQHGWGVAQRIRQLSDEVRAASSETPGASRARAVKARPSRLLPVPK